MAATDYDRFPRLMLTYDIRRRLAPALLADMLAIEACAAIILYDSGDKAEEAVFQKAAEPLVPLIRNCGLPVLIAENSSLCGRLKADGVHIEEQDAQSPEILADMRRKYGEKRLLGYGNPHNRHNALEAGEERPDYMFFGKLGKDKNPAPHPRNVALGAWWAAIVQIDCIIQAGSALASLAGLAATQADFIAVEEAVFAASDPPAALAQAQNLLARRVQTGQEI
ncbi:MAG: thiamine phosphate synthase [Candidatus Tokpelaia sp.]|uniref:thiamine phosphate synthase n=1 Tax=Candidatus Tokpelaia sp. TaxID=2233777 RepID=UPI00123B99D1|nr:thiamine phosphate synthase [Candidatus Tokpelaia sp.]KAA6206257.1 MAG: thiamine phosphate synthase [Candidatus Tokpelaia sp.]KAA6206329.1 MAG: thiamine phosphate synthase [Candidatus Tokpelaia sp.]KAA6406312.1 thiamine phosphate synthase [Candidatus Tokpelaia sp.]